MLRSKYGGELILSDHNSSHIFSCQVIINDDFSFQVNELIGILVVESSDDMEFVFRSPPTQPHPASCEQIPNASLFCAPL